MRQAYELQAYRGQAYRGHGPIERQDYKEDRHWEVGLLGVAKKGKKEELGWYSHEDAGPL